MNNKFFKIFKLLFLINIVIFSNINVYAFSNTFAENNDIQFYDPNDTGFDLECSDSVSNINYTEQTIENQKKVLEILKTLSFNKNNGKPLNNVQIAAIMGNIMAESTFIPNSGVSDNSSYKGLVQWSSGRWSNISEPKDLTAQINYIKTELDGDYYGNNIGDFWNITEYSDLEKATFLFTRNYEVAINVETGGGSTKWEENTNPSLNLQLWQERVKYAKDLFSKYNNTCSGMTEEQAIEYMENYENLDGTSLYQPTICNAYSTGEPDYASKVILANCVAVVVNFLQNNTTYGDKIPVPDGKNVVKTLLSYGFIDGANIPKPFAVFSTGFSSEHGHTGLVLGVQDGYIIVFEEGCSAKLNKDGGTFSGINKYTMSEATTKYTYAYPPSGSLIGL